MRHSKSPCTHGQLRLTPAGARGSALAAGHEHAVLPDGRAVAQGRLLEQNELQLVRLLIPDSEHVLLVPLRAAPCHVHEGRGGRLVPEPHRDAQLGPHERLPAARSGQQRHFQLPVGGAEAAGGEEEAEGGGRAAPGLVRVRGRVRVTELKFVEL